MILGPARGRYPRAVSQNVREFELGLSDINSFEAVDDAESEGGILLA